MNIVTNTNCCTVRSRLCARCQEASDKMVAVNKPELEDLPLPSPLVENVGFFGAEFSPPGFPPPELDDEGEPMLIPPTLTDLLAAEKRQQPTRQSVVTVNDPNRDDLELLELPSTMLRSGEAPSPPLTVCRHSGFCAVGGRGAFWSVYPTAAAPHSELARSTRLADSTGNGRSKDLLPALPFGD